MSDASPKRYAASGLFTEPAAITADQFEARMLDFSKSIVQMKDYVKEQLLKVEEEKETLRREKDRLMELDRVMSARETALQKKLEVFENRNQLVEERYGHMDDIIQLDVGGEPVSTTRATLCSVEGSMLEAMFSGRHNLKKNGDRFFIDRDPRLFRYVMSFLRTHKLDLPDDSAERSMVLREFDYFCINTSNPTEDFLTKEWKNTQTLGGHDDIVMCLRVIDKERLLSGSKDKAMRIWDLKSGKCIQKFEGHTSSVRHLKIYDNKIITASHDKSLKVWDMNTGQIVQTFEGHNEYVMCIKVVKSEGLLFSGAHDATVKTWDLKTGKCLHSFTAHSSGVSCIKVVGNSLYTGSDDKTIKVWDRTTWECRRVLAGHEQYVMSIKVRGNTLYSGSWDKSIKVWNLNSGECMLTLKGHTQGVYAIKVIEDVIVSCSGDNSIKIWDAKTGTCHRTLEGHKRHVMAIKVVGNVIYSGSSDKTIKVWEVAQT